MESISKAAKNKAKRERKRLREYEFDEEYYWMIEETDDEEIKNALEVSRSKVLAYAQFKPTLRTVLTKYFRMKKKVDTLKKNQMRENEEMEIDEHEENPAVERIRKECEDMKKLMERVEIEKKAALEECNKLEQKLESQEMEINEKMTEMRIAKEGLEKEVQRLTGEKEKLGDDSKIQKKKNLELLKASIDSRMKKLVNGGEEYMSIEQNKVAELTEIVELQKKELEALRAEETVSVDRKQNALNAALLFCGNERDEAHRKEIGSRDEKIERMNSEHGALSDAKDRLTKQLSDCQAFYDMFIRDLTEMIKATNNVLGVNQQEEPKTVQETLKQFYMKYQETLRCLADSKKEVEELKTSILKLEGTLAQSQAETTNIKNELNKECRDRERVSKWLDCVISWLKYGEEHTKFEDRLASSNQVMTGGQMESLIFYTGYNPKSPYQRPKKL